jgi:hypothetical protein
MTGVITAIDLAAGTVTLQDDAGQERVIPLASVTMRADGREVDVTKLRLLRLDHSQEHQCMLLDRGFQLGRTAHCQRAS